MPAAQRSSSVPAPRALPHTGAASSPAAVAVARGLATLEPDGSVVFAPPPDDVGATSAVAASSASFVQRVPEALSAAPAAPSPPAAEPGPAVPALPSPAAAGAGLDNEQLDQLAKQLWDRVRERLRAELRLDRERSGRVTDLAW